MPSEMSKNLSQNSLNSSNLAAELKTLPEKAGVYQYFNAQNRLLYVGKAKNLKHRVRSYFVFTPNLAHEIPYAYKKCLPSACI